MEGLFFGILRYHLMLSGNFCGSKSRHCILGGYILVQGFLGVLFEALRLFFGFDFCRHSIIPVT